MIANISSFISQFHGVTGLQWKIGGKFRRPTLEDIETVLDELSKAVYDKPGQQAQTGGILVANNNGHYDVYLHIGEI